jgi:hypothetical protein
MKALALALLLTQAPPADAPVKPLGCEEVLLITGKALVAEQAKSADLAKSLKDAPVVTAPVVVVGAVALLVGVGAGVAIGFAVKR